MHNHTSRHFVKMGEFKCVCSFQQYSKKECNLSARNKSARSIFIVKNCSSSTREHLFGCLKPPGKESRKTVNYVWPALDCSTSAEKISRFVPSTGTNLAWDGGQVKFVNILSIRANRNRTEEYPGRCQEKYTYTSVRFARLDKVTHYILKWPHHEIKYKFYHASELK